MPANLTQQYINAESAYRKASTPEEELQCLAVMLRELPKHKGTENLQSDLKTKISKLKKALQSGKGSSSRRYGFRLPRQGAGRVTLVGGPNAGKSQLIAALTSFEPEIAPYPFTTRMPAPAMMPFEDVFVQLIDTPPITDAIFTNETKEMIRTADLVLFLMDLGSDDGGEECRNAFNAIQSTKTRLGESTGPSDDEIGVSTTRTFFVINKIDLLESNDRIAFFREYIDLEKSFPTFRISAKTGEGVEPLRKAIYQTMDVVRIYTKQPHQKEVDFEKPFTLPTGSTLKEVAELIHQDLAKNLKGGRVWGSQVHDATPVKVDYVLADKDIVELLF